MEMYTESKSVQGSTCPYIYTKVRGMEGGTSTDVYVVNILEQGRTNTYDVYGGYKSKRDICMDTVGKVRKGINYDGDMQQGLYA